MHLFQAFEIDDHGEDPQNHEEDEDGPPGVFEEADTDDDDEVVLIQGPFQLDGPLEMNGPPPGRCFNCGEYHWRTDCPFARGNVSLV